MRCEAFATSPSWAWVKRGSTREPPCDAKPSQALRDGHGSRRRVLVIDAGAGAVLGTGNERPAWLEHETAFEKTVKICVFIVVIAAVLYPFLSVLATSLASEPDVIKNGGLVIWPEHPTLQAYHTIFAGGVVTRAITVSVGITVIGTLLSLAVTIGMAYGLSRRIYGARFVMLLALFTLVFTTVLLAKY